MEKAHTFTGSAFVQDHTLKLDINGNSAKYLRHAGIYWKLDDADYGHLTVKEAEALRDHLTEILDIIERDDPIKETVRDKINELAPGTIIHFERDTGFPVFNYVVGPDGNLYSQAGMRAKTVVNEPAEDWKFWVVAP